MTEEENKNYKNNIVIILSMNGRMLIIGSLVMGVFASMAYGHFSGENTTEVENEPPPQMILSLEERERSTEAEIHRLVNIERNNYGVKNLEYDFELAAIAKAHSQDMYQNDYFLHVTPDGVTPANRGEIAGYDCAIDIDELEYYNGIVENMFKQESATSLISEEPQVVAENAVSWWMSSTSHRSAILDNLLSDEGIGVIINDYSIHITQNFC